MADDEQQQPPEEQGEDRDVEEAPSTSTHEDDETSTRAEVEPDVEVGEAPVNGEHDPEDRPIEWRPGRRHGRSAESERRDD